LVIKHPLSLRAGPEKTKKRRRTLRFGMGAPGCNNLATSLSVRSAYGALICPVAIDRAQIAMQ
jgi:hypothetical protein